MVDMAGALLVTVFIKDGLIRLVCKRPNFPVNPVQTMRSHFPHTLYFCMLFLSLIYSFKFIHFAVPLIKQNQIQRDRALCIYIESQLSHFLCFVCLLNSLVGCESLVCSVRERRQEKKKLGLF